MPRLKRIRSSFASLKTFLDLFKKSEKVLTSTLALSCEALQLSGTCQQLISAFRAPNKLRTSAVN